MPELRPVDGNTEKQAADRPENEEITPIRAAISRCPPSNRAKNHKTGFFEVSKRTTENSYRKTSGGPCGSAYDDRAVRLGHCRDHVRIYLHEEIYAAHNIPDQRDRADYPETLSCFPETGGTPTPYEYTCKIWTIEPKRFKLNPIHQMLRLNT